MPCLIKPDMHHTCLCIMPCLCVVCLPCCLLLSGLLLSLASVSFRSCEDSFDYVRLSSSWTRSSSLRDFRQDDRYPGSHYYHCYASCFVLSLCCVTYLCSLSLPNCHEPLTFDTFPMQTVAWLCYRFSQPSYSVSSCR